MKIPGYVVIEGGLSWTALEDQVKQALKVMRANNPPEHMAEYELLAESLRDRLAEEMPDVPIEVLRQVAVRTMSKMGGLVGKLAGCGCHEPPFAQAYSIILLALYPPDDPA